MCVGAFSIALSSYENKVPDITGKQSRQPRQCRFVPDRRTFFKGPTENTSGIKVRRVASSRLPMLQPQQTDNAKGELQMLKPGYAAACQLPVRRSKGKQDEHDQVERCILYICAMHNGHKK